MAVTQISNFLRDSVPSLWSLVLIFIGVGIAYGVGVGIQRVYFHPLSGFPGPKLAAATLWYEFYYDCVLRGQYLFKIKQMHEKYGPIIRINPYELHFSTPDFFGEIYTQTGRRDVWQWQRRGFGADDSTLGTRLHDHHRLRRGAINPLFSKQRIVKLLPTIKDRLTCLVARFEKFEQDGRIINLQHAFGAFAADVGMEYFFRESQDKVNAPDFDPVFHDAINAGFNNLIIMNHFPWIMDAMIGISKKIPDWAIQKYFSSQQSTTFVSTSKIMRTQVRRILSAPVPAKEDAANHTLFDQILSSSLAPSEKTPSRMVQEGILLMVGATLSTAWSMSVATYCLIQHPHVLQRLKQEFEATFPDGPESVNDLPKLEHMTYLSAVINESLRIGIAVSHRSARINPDGPTFFTDPANGRRWTIPAGTPMSMSHPLLMRDPSIFPDPTRFRPERWIEDPSLERYQFVFSKGTRGCIGINLAWTEIRLVIANVFTRYGTETVRGKWDRGLVELFETDDRDVECEADGALVLAKKNSKGIRIRLRALPGEKDQAHPLM